MENTNETNKEKNIQLAVLEKIETDSVEMRSKAHFYVLMALSVFVAALILVISVFLCNVILFTVLESGRSLLLGFGGRGILSFLWFFPWWLLAVDVLLLVIFERMMRRYKFGYRLPSLYLGFAVLVLVIVAGSFIQRVTEVNHRIAPRPPRVSEGMCRCTVVSFDGTTLVVVEREAGALPFTVVLPTGLPFSETDGLIAGDTVFVAGDMKGGILYAFGMHRMRAGERAAPRARGAF